VIKDKPGNRQALADVIGPGLKVLFCGINPSLDSAKRGHHFAGHSNRFWSALHQAGFADLSPAEDWMLPALGYGITNIVPRATAKADELAAAELKTGVMMLEQKVQRFEPGVVAFLGLGDYRRAFGRMDAVIGPQMEHRIAGAAVWLLPHPSGRVTQYPPSKLARLFAELRLAMATPLLMVPDKLAGAR
jgi:TDG/mug DNA glycosylase family protein